MPDFLKILQQAHLALQKTITSTFEFQIEEFTFKYSPSMTNFYY